MRSLNYFSYQNNFLGLSKRNVIWQFFSMQWGAATYKKVEEKNQLKTGKSIDNKCNFLQYLIIIIIAHFNFRVSAIRLFIFNLKNNFNIQTSYNITCNMHTSFMITLFDSFNSWGNNRDLNLLGLLASNVVKIIETMIF